MPLIFLLIYFACNFSRDFSCLLKVLDMTLRLSLCCYFAVIGTQCVSGSETRCL